MDDWFETLQVPLTKARWVQLPLTKAMGPVMQFFGSHADMLCSYPICFILHYADAEARTAVVAELQLTFKASFLLCCMARLRMPTGPKLNRGAFLKIGVPPGPILVSALYTGPGLKLLGRSQGPFKRAPNCQVGASPRLWGIRRPSFCLLCVIR